MQQELKDTIMEALYKALECGSEMLSTTSNDFKVQDIGERLIYAIDNLQASFPMGNAKIGRRHAR